MHDMNLCLQVVGIPADSARFKTHSEGVKGTCAVWDWDHSKANTLKMVLFYSSFAAVKFSLIVNKGEAMVYAVIHILW